MALSACAGGGGSSPNAILPQAGTPQSQSRSIEAKKKKVKDGQFRLFGDAKLIHPGDNSHTAVQEIWSPSQPFGGIDFGLPAHLTVSQLNTLSTDFKFTQGTCSQGSPRFQINVDGKNVFAYLGPQFPNTVTNPCAGATYSNSTNQLGPDKRVDATQLHDGNEPWAAFQAQHGSDAVTGIQLVVDGFTTPYITAQFDNTQINNELFTYEGGRACDSGANKDDDDNGPCTNDGDSD